MILGIQMKSDLCGQIHFAFRYFSNLPASGDPTEIKTGMFPRTATAKVY